jgi:hypothetical protein
MAHGFNVFLKNHKMNGMRDPLWRIVLCWGVVITYLSAPLAFFIIYLNSSENLLTRLMHGPGYLRDFYISLTGLLFSLAGLNTYQAVSTKRNEADDGRLKHSEKIKSEPPPGEKPSPPKSKRSD